jgi:hypothetical protein
MFNSMSVPCARQPRWFISDVVSEMIRQAGVDARDGVAVAAASRWKNVYTAELLG